MISHWNEISEKRKLIYALSALLLTLILAFQYVVDPTYQEWEKSVKLKSQIEALRTNNSEIHFHDHEDVKFLDNVYDGQMILLEMMEKCTKEFTVELISITEPLTTEQNSIKTIYIEAGLKGNFHEQLKTIHELELNAKGWYLQSVNIKSQFEKQKKNNELLTVLCFKSLIK